MVARRLTVTGHVQGVFFRASTRDRARDAGIAGWVANRPDGSVEAHLQGPADAVDAVESWIRSGGPRDAVVEQVDAAEVEETDTDGFTIVR